MEQIITVIGGLFFIIGLLLCIASSLFAIRLIDNNEEKQHI